MLLLPVLAGCSKEDKNETEDTGVFTEASATIEGVNDSTWVYFSFVTGTVVGTSTFGNAEEDARWYDRVDWDIALCSDMIRTNSGTSGVGSGGIQVVTDRNFNAITTAPADGYSVDRNDILVER